MTVPPVLPATLERESGKPISEKDLKVIMSFEDGHFKGPYRLIKRLAIEKDWTKSDIPEDSDIIDIRIVHIGKSQNVKEKAIYGLALEDTSVPELETELKRVEHQIRDYHQLRNNHGIPDSVREEVDKLEERRDRLKKEIVAKKLEARNIRKYDKKEVITLIKADIHPFIIKNRREYDDFIRSCAFHYEMLSVPINSREELEIRGWSEWEVPVLVKMLHDHLRIRSNARVVINEFRRTIWLWRRLLSRDHPARDSFKMTKDRNGNYHRKKDHIVAMEYGKLLWEHQKESFIYQMRAYLELGQVTLPDMWDIYCILTGEPNNLERVELDGKTRKELEGAILDLCKNRSASLRGQGGERDRKYRLEKIRQWFGK